MFPIMRELLKERYPDIKVIPYTKFPTVEASEDIDRTIVILKEGFLRHSCDAVISGVGG
ncbi:hypothetical protein ACFLUK_02975 [Chloroflexota bacterium]